MDKTKINQGIVNFYQEKYNKKFPKKYNIENPYNVQEFIFKIADPIFNKCDKTGIYNETYTVYPEDNLEDIMKYLGYEDIVFKYKNMERLDFDLDWDKINYIFSYKKVPMAANTELSFISYLGCHCDPIEMIQFIYFTILNYENTFEWDDYHKT